MSLQVVLASVASRFRRVTTSGSYMPEIDGLRFVAIAAVVALHVWGYLIARAGRSYDHWSRLDTALQGFISLGYYGVHLFFMISGFVLAVPFCKHALTGSRAVDLRAYFWRRLTRLEPPYIISMLAFFALMPLFGKGSWHDLWPHLLASLGYVHNIAYGSGSLINNNAWSLEVEVQFYLLMPLLAGVLWLAPAVRRSVLGGLAVILSLHVLWLPHGFPKSILQFGQYFLLGIVLCDLWTVRWRHVGRAWLADMPGIAAWPCFAAVNLARGGILADVANPWLIALFFYSALRGNGHGRVLSWGWIPLVGGMCYSIYLLHARVIAAVVHGVVSRYPSLGSFTADYALTLGLSSVAVLAVSSLFFLTIEKPCMDPDWPRKAWRWLAGNRHGGTGARAPGESVA